MKMQHHRLPQARDGEVQVKYIPLTHRTGARLLRVVYSTSHSATPTMAGLRLAGRALTREEAEDLSSVYKWNTRIAN